MQLGDSYLEQWEHDIPNTKAKLLNCYKPITDFNV